MNIAQNTKMQSTDGVKAAAAQDENSSACNNKV
jgi:hypothetical protein